MAALGWVGCAAVVAAWAGTAAWDRFWGFVNRTEVLAVFEDAESTPIYDELAAESDFVGRLAEFEAGRALTDDRIADFLNGWTTEDGQS